MSLDLRALLQQFLNKCESDPDFALYNEAGLQHEVAWFLRKQFEGTKYHVQLERNVDDIVNPIKISGCIKREMDIFVYEKYGDEKYCIELKFPNKGAFPRRMYQTFEDVAFLEQLRFKGDFKGVALLFITSLNGFINGSSSKGIYQYFREKNCICQPDYSSMQEFLKDKKKFKPLDIKGQYRFEWLRFREQYHYFMIAF
ncbi:hypothetical protein ACFLTJ_02835 [Chloroflexota bacterium]